MFSFIRIKKQAECEGIKTDTLFFAFAARVNNQYVTLKNGRRALSKQSKRWKRAALQELELMRFDGRISDSFLQVATTGYLSLFVDFYFKSPLRRDLDGGLKILQDTICQAIGVNDNRVVDIHLIKRMVQGAFALKYY